MWVVASIALIAALLGLGSSPSSSRSSASGPFLLVTLPSLGTVTWRCRGADDAFALGYRASPRYATTDVVLWASGKIVLRRTVQPGDRLRLPSLPDRKQGLSLIQGTGAGFLRASVRTYFGPPASASFCWDYSPPRTVVEVSTRQ